MGTADGRHHGLDAARALAMVAVVAGHAALSFMETPIGWAIQDDYRHLGVDLLIWILASFAMPAFFWLSGYFARAVYAHGGPGGFFRHRITRVLAPLLVALVPCSLALDALWDWGRTVGGRAAVAANIPKLQGSDLPITLGHLWYLYYLLAMSLVAAVIAPVARRLRIPPLRGVALLALVAVIAIGALTAVRTLHLDTPLGFAIDPAVAAYMGAFFLWGWHVHAHPAELDRLARLAWPAAAACPLLLLALVRVLLDAADPAHTAPPPLYAIAASGLFTMALIVAFLGLCLRFARRSRALFRLASEASYWFYVAHLPIVVFLQIALAHAPVPGPLKYAAIIIATTAICLGTYELVIRRTRLRRVLG
jgi:peptidoglycan/LPS O-acetylase OafA/YrhL